MILVDVNVLLYAHNNTAPQHESARAWLEQTLASKELIRLPGTVVLGFLRIGTNPKVHTKAHDTEEAFDLMKQLLDHPRVGTLEPGPRYWQIFRRVALAAHARADLIMDAHLAALAIEHGATICTTDRDFSKFPEVRVLNPLA